MISSLDISHVFSNAGRFLTSAAFDCAASQAKCDELGTFVSGLPQDTVVLIAIQESGLVSGRSLPTSQLKEVGIQSSSTLGPNSSFTSIGYKGKNAVDWKKEAHNNDSAGPTTIAALIPVNRSYVPPSGECFSHLRNEKETRQKTSGTIF